MLRAFDVRGHWLPSTGKEGGIIRDGKRWQDGLTWDMFAPDLSSFTKVISKTVKSQPEPLTFALTPELKTRIEGLGNGKRVGPVIVSRLGVPNEQKAWGRTWKRIRESLGLPADLKLMDIRSGAITEARAMGADPVAARQLPDGRETASGQEFFCQHTISASNPDRQSAWYAVSQHDLCSIALLAFITSRSTSWSLT